MLGQIYHVGVTVSDLDRSVAFYREILNLHYQGEILMEGLETDAIFGRKDCRARVAYLNGSHNPVTPSVELIQFITTHTDKQESDLFRTSVSEICFWTDDIDKVYRHLQENHVECLSEPQIFDFSASGFGKSRAFYFKDPDGIILEVMQSI